jgi:dinuclear metal center YbgI/SA1388 family protein
MESLNGIVRFLDRYLEIDSIKDSSWNGLQYEGKPEVKQVLFAADAGIETFEKAAALDADLIVVHHGLFWNSTNPCLVGWFKKRVSVLWNHGISPYAVHLPLDRHRVVGNNAQLLKLLGAKIQNGFCEIDGNNIGWIGAFKQPVSLKEVEKKLNKGLNTHCTVIPFGKKSIKTIAVVSGAGGSRGFYEALKAGVDLYLTGELFEVYHAAKDTAINVIFGGHHATETLGVKALSELVKRKFEVKTVFVDIPTGL